MYFFKITVQGVCQNLQNLEIRLNDLENIKYIQHFVEEN